MSAGWPQDVNTGRYKLAFSRGKAKVLREPCPVHSNHYAVGLFETDGKAVEVDGIGFGFLCPIFLFLAKARTLIFDTDPDITLAEWLEKAPLQGILKQIEEV